MAQTWDDLLFAHWRCPADALKERLPERLEPDTFDDEAWLGVTPFRLAALRLRGTLLLPLLSSFLELNVRTYVRAGKKPGVWFFSLDAANELAVEMARRLYKLPYFRARMSAVHAGEWIEYSSRRRDVVGEPAAFEGRYRPAGEVFHPRPGSLEEFLTERYCLYATDERGRLHRAEIHHPPWSLQQAEAEIETNTMAPPGIEVEGAEPLLHFAARQDVVVWALEPVA